MISTTIPFAPARVPGSGSVVARPHACATARRPVAGVFAGVQGTGVSMTAKRRGVDLAVLGFQPALPTTQNDPISIQNDGTTPLGIHSPGRPKS